MAKYAVRTWGGRTYTVEAADSNTAKKLVCKILGRPTAAPLIGVKGMTAKKM